jgi:DNA (cytosine-5)-methyltransferase 1
MTGSTTRLENRPGNVDARLAAMREKRNPTVFELFAGAGLFGAAFDAEGFSLRLAVELDQTAAATYRHNVGAEIAIADVKRLSPGGKCDVLIAGPPCQCFSTLNRARSNDARTNLCLSIADWAARCRPSIVVIENVAPFLDAPVWRRLARRLTILGYRIQTATVQALEFGVPQSRKRSFTVASRRNVEAFAAPHQTRAMTIAEAWAGLSAEPDGVNNHISPNPSPIALARMKVIPAGGDKRDILRKRPDLAPKSWCRVQSEVTDVWGRMRWDRPANTIRTCCQNASKGRYIHPVQHRVISLREAARLQGFPDSFYFHGLPTQVARQIGNAVPFSLGRAIAKLVRCSL